MAATWIASIQGIAWTATKVAGYVLNAAGSGVVVRVYRCWLTSPQITTVTGATNHIVQVQRMTAVTTATTVTPVAYDTASTALPAQVTAGSAASVTAGTNLERFYFPCDEVALPSVAASWTNLFALFPMALVFDAGYGDNSVGCEPIVCREGQGLALVCSTGGTVGTYDCQLEFTVT